MEKLNGTQNENSIEKVIKRRNEDKNLGGNFEEIRKNKTSFRPCK